MSSSSFINSVFSTSSPQAKEITSLTLWVFLICTVIFIFVAVWIGYSVIKFRYRGEAGEPDQTPIHHNYEITWTIIPALICVWLGYITVASMFGPRSGEPLRTSDPDIIITGAQWWWDVRYPKLGITTANEIHLPTGRPLVVELESFDVIHAFWVPDLGRKQQMIPGHHNFITVQEDIAGEYLGVCAQYCGNQHAWMRLLVVAQGQGDFDAWAASQKVAHPFPTASTPGATTSAPTALQEATSRPAPSQTLAFGSLGSAGTASSSVIRGAHIFQDQTCGSCHAIEGISSARYAPDLTHIASRETLGSGVLVNNHDNLVKWIHNPQAIKPGCNMPNFQFSTDQTNDLVAYLETLQ